MAAYTYPLLNIFWTMLWLFVLILWIWLLITIFIDIFRSHDLSGGAKALWVIFLIVLPFVGVIVYLIARGDKMQKHEIKEAQQEQEAFDEYVKKTAGSSSTADELAKLADLKNKGVISDAEFDQAKAKLVG